VAEVAPAATLLDLLVPGRCDGADAVIGIRLSHLSLPGASRARLIAE
jgi:hypothetical protein